MSNRERWPDQQIKRLLIMLDKSSCDSVQELMQEYDMSEWYFSWTPPATWRS